MIYEQILTYFADDELILTGKKKKKNYNTEECWHGTHSTWRKYT